MLKEDTLGLLFRAKGPLSGEAISRELGVSRAAVWKAVNALREDGYGIESRPGQGYRLISLPDALSAGELARPDRLVGREVLCFETLDSTNNECRRRAAQGDALAPDGLAVLAGEQTAGKGRRGRSFQSLRGKGLYLSVLLRPSQDVPPEEVTQLTAWAAVAVCRAVERVSGLSCAIKWTNDILLEGKKVCGILSELGLDDDGRCDYAVVGIGVNIAQTGEDFGPELAGAATSLGQHMAAPPRRGELAAALLEELDALWRVFPAGKREYLDEYRARCATVGQPVRVIAPDRTYEARALAVNEDFSLRVALPDGREERIFTGEVSVRGLP